ncbi:hypothetical protein C7N83_07010 [Neisseria iguanae]|uniref:Uncharacterized protein n=1 Tax=Neisseria iguanae TaxID=90242 RepID=A0A2P7U096_9NEIS|nr:hypothetical protein C7N83_07010 [Neisseria iguanae]
MKKPSEKSARRRQTSKAALSPILRFFAVLVGRIFNWIVNNLLHIASYRPSEKILFQTAFKIKRNTSTDI